MKHLAILVSLITLSVQAYGQDVEKFIGLDIKPIEKVKKHQSLVTINGVKFAKQLAVVAVSKDNSKSASVTDITLPTVITGEIVYSEDGFNEFLVTGEIIVKLNADVDFSTFNQEHDLSIKQAYKNFYILKSQSNDNLLTVVEKLTALPQVLSATIDLVDRNINHF